MTRASVQRADADPASPAMAADEAARLAGIKREHAARYPDDRAAYQDGKASFIAPIVDAAMGA